MGSQNRWRIRLKVWLEIDGHPVIGEGRLAMLAAIDEKGSIIDAARQLDISYRRIRGAISDMEASMGTCLVKTHRGGVQGGGAKLTPHARALVQKYMKVVREFSVNGEFRSPSENNKKLPPNGRNCHSVSMGG
ncbi:MAG: LysR family transcriptional regulator [Desulfobacter sp.]|nr:MAG: LysR family transcriptional regulator [Desulfobacter sp.]